MRTSTISVQNVKSVRGELQTDKITRSASATPHVAVVVSSLLAVAVAAALMSLTLCVWLKPPPIMVATGYISLAGIVAASAALERLLEPISSIWNPPGSQQGKRNAKQAKAANAGAGGNQADLTVAQAMDKVQEAADDPQASDEKVARLVQTAADKQAKLRADKTIFYWALASICGLGISGGFGFLLLQSVATSHVNKVLDLVVTGLVIGSGTKPMHDLIVGMQSK